MITDPTQQPPTPFDPSTLPTIDPALLQRQARGMAAANELSALNQGPAMARALRMQDAPAPGVVGHGYAAQGPTLLQGLAHMVSKRQGGNRVREMERQAQALRGEVTGGQQAQLEAQAQQNLIDRQQQMNLAQIQSDERLKRDIALNQQRIDLENVRQGGVTGPYKAYFNPETGDFKYAARSKGKGMVDENVQPTSMEGYLPYDAGAQRRFGSGFEGLKAPERKRVIDANFGIRQINQINDIANKMTQEEWQQLNKPGFDVVLKMASPQDAQQYMNEKMKGLSPRSKQYLAKVQNFVSQVRKNRFGTAQSMNETALFEAFSPGASGIGLVERNQRLNNFYDQILAEVRAVDDFYRTDLESRLPEFREFEINEDMIKRMGTEGTGFTQSPAMQKEWENMERMNEEYKALSGGKNLPEYDRWAPDFSKPAAKKAQRKQATDTMEFID